MIFIPFKVVTRLLLEGHNIYEQNIARLHCLKKKSSLRKFRHDFLIILVDVMLFIDPDPGVQKVPDPVDSDKDPQHCYILYI